MINLDDKEAILKTQGGDAVLRSVDLLQKQLEQSFAESLEIKFPEEYRSVKNVVVCGMGGSRFPALIIKYLFKDRLKVPYVINDNYTLPGFVNESTLVVLSSYSGTTEEVVECGHQAHQRKAKVTGVTAGGDVEKKLKENGFPVYVFDPIHNPSGQPRIGFGYGVGGHLGLLVNLNLVDMDKQEILDAVNNQQLLTDFKVDVPKEKNPAKQLAEKLYGKYPYYVVSEFLTGVGNAVGNQTNETAKAISSFRVIPELNHHLMEGLKHPEELKQLAIFVFYYSFLYSQPIQKRYQITKDVVEQNGLKTEWVELKGKNKIEQTIELMGFGSYLSMYLAALYEEDPTVIPYVDYFKKKLKEV